MTGKHPIRTNYPGNVYYSFDWKWSVQRADGTTENYSNVDLTYYYKNLMGQSDFKLIYSEKEDIQNCIDGFKAAYTKDGDVSLGETIMYSLQPQVSFTVMDQKTGYIKAIVGGRGEKETSLSLNRATHSPRQPGSCFKVLAAFAPALDACDMSLATVYNDAPFNYSNGRTGTELVQILLGIKYHQACYRAVHEHRSGKSHYGCDTGTCL